MTAAKAKKIGIGFIFLSLAMLVFGKPLAGTETREVPIEISRQIASELGLGVDADPVVVFTTPYCPGCKALENFLNKKGIQYYKADIGQDPAARRGFEALVAGGWSGGVPQTLVGTKVIIGYKPREIFSSIKELRGEATG